MTYCRVCGNDVVGLIYCPKKEGEYCFHCHDKVCRKVIKDTYSEIFG